MVKCVRCKDHEAGEGYYILGGQMLWNTCFRCYQLAWRMWREKN